ncbi:unnamed protein product [Choristocarpus tenellus]
MLAGTPLPSTPPSESDQEHFKKLNLMKKVVVMGQRIKATPTFTRIASPPVLG